MLGWQRHAIRSATPRFKSRHNRSENRKSPMATTGKATTTATFFSYSRKDSEFAARLARDLKAAGANVWLDQIDIEPGMEWDRAVEEAVKAAPRILLILSPASVNSRNVRDEISFALQENKVIIPVLYQDCSIPLQLRRIQYVDLRGDYAHGLETLLKTLMAETSSLVRDEVRRFEEAETQARAAAEHKAQQEAEEARRRAEAENTRKEAVARKRAETERRGEQETEDLARDKPEAERLAAAKVEAQRKAAEISEIQQTAGERVEQAGRISEKAKRKAWQYWTATVVASVILTLFFVLSRRTGPQPATPQMETGTRSIAPTPPAKGKGTATMGIEGQTGAIVGPPAQVEKAVQPVPAHATPQMDKGIGSIARTPPTNGKGKRTATMGEQEIATGVLAVTGVPGDPHTFFFGGASGGLWKTTDGGNTWELLGFDKKPALAIGTIAVVRSNPNTIYVGTGETCLRNDTSRGNGVYRSIDGGKSWVSIGLLNSRHIGALIVHPYDPRIVFVAALGDLDGPNADRGVYKSADGGNTWQKVLFAGGDTGAIDLAFDVHNPDVLFAALGKAPGAPLGGPQSGLYKSVDGGRTWKDLQSGLPEGILVRIGAVSVSGADSNRVYALIEGEKRGLYVSDDGGNHWKLVNSDQRLTQRASCFTHVFADQSAPDAVYVLNTGVFRSRDGGNGFTQLPTPRGDHHALWIDPTNPQRMIVGNDGGAAITTDGGKTWTTPKI